MRRPGAVGTNDDLDVGDLLTGDLLQRLLDHRDLIGDRLLPVAGRLAFHARTAILRIDARWPWRDTLINAFTCARALPAPA